MRGATAQVVVPVECVRDVRVQPGRCNQVSETEMECNGVRMKFDCIRIKNRQ